MGYGTYAAGSTFGLAALTVAGYLLFTGSGEAFNVGGRHPNSS